MFKEKLHKKLFASLQTAGITEPLPLQAMSLPKINSGADVLIIGPESSGMSTLISILAVQKLQYAVEEAPRMLVLVANKEAALAMREQFDTFAKETDLRCVAAFDEGDLEAQNEDIYTGTDMVIGTPKRTAELYQTRNLNLNKIKTFIIDSPEMMVKGFWQGQIDRLSVSLPKCQRLVFTTDPNEKVMKVVEKLMPNPQVVELEEE